MLFLLVVVVVLLWVLLLQMCGLPVERPLAAAVADCAVVNSAVADMPANVCLLVCVSRNSNKRPFLFFRREKTDTKHSLVRQKKH